MAVYTSCVTVGNHKGLTEWLGVAGLKGVLAAVTLLFLGGGMMPATAVPALLLIIAYCHWWLEDRLICLDGERCAVGLLGSVEPPNKKSGLDRFDTDYSINLILAPHNFQAGPLPPLTPPQTSPGGGDDPADELKLRMHHWIADDGIQGNLIRETSTTSDPRTLLGAKRFPFEGYFNTLGAAGVKYHYQPYMHCEFEGGGVKKLLEAAEAALGFSAAAAVACTIPFLGWGVCALLNIIAAVIMIVGVVNALGDTGNPTHVNPSLTTLNQGSDVFIVKGRWVFDSAHEGWNEIHPVTYAVRIGSYDIHVIRGPSPPGQTPPVPSDLPGYWFSLLKNWRKQLDPKITDEKLNEPASPGEWKAFTTFLCDSVGRATSALTHDSQKRPENQWTVHPDLDGCRPAAQVPSGTGGLH